MSDPSSFSAIAAIRQNIVAVGVLYAHRFVLSLLIWADGSLEQLLGISSTMISLFLEVALLAALPGLYALGVSFACWSGTAKPWLFASSCAVSLYVLYFVVLYFGDPRGGGFFLEARRHDVPGEPSHQLELVFLGPYIKPMILFSVLAVPLLWLLVKAFRSQP